MAEEKWVEIDDTNIVAYLHLMGFKFCPFRKVGTEGRIGFRVYGDVESELANFYNDVPVGIQSYVACLKKVRGSMFLIKGMDNSDQKTKED